MKVFFRLPIPCLLIYVCKNSVNFSLFKILLLQNGRFFWTHFVILLKSRNPAALFSLFVFWILLFSGLPFFTIAVASFTVTYLCATIHGRFCPVLCHLPFCLAKRAFSRGKKGQNAGRNRPFRRTRRPVMQSAVSQRVAPNAPFNTFNLNPSRGSPCRRHLVSAPVARLFFPCGVVPACIPFHINNMALGGVCQEMRKSCIVFETFSRKVLFCVRKVATFASAFGKQPGASKKRVL